MRPGRAPNVAGRSGLSFLLADVCGAGEDTPDPLHVCPGMKRIEENGVDWNILPLWASVQSK